MTLCSFEVGGPLQTTGWAAMLAQNRNTFHRCDFDSLADSAADLPRHSICHLRKRTLVRFDVMSGERPVIAVWTGCDVHQLRRLEHGNFVPFTFGHNAGLTRT